MGIARKRLSCNETGISQENGCLARMGILQGNEYLARKWVSIKEMGILQDNGCLARKWVSIKEMGILQGTGYLRSVHSNPTRQDVPPHLVRLALHSCIPCGLALCDVRTIQQSQRRL
eukprot:1959253-Pleurochrysis_carterae.AAC.1